MTQVEWFISDAGGARMEQRPAPDLIPDTPKGQEANLIQLYTDVPRQTLQGFGGAFTQSAAAVYAAMPAGRQQELVRLLFSRQGLGYTCGRIPIGACDFSEGGYTYCDEEDPALNGFSLERDARLIFPFLRDAMRESPQLELLASPWTPPAWMKTNGELCHGGKLKEEHYGTLARYFVRYLQACRSAGIPVRFVNCQNEPKATQIWESCVYTAQEERRFLLEFLAPALREAGLDDVGIVIWDHNKERSFLRAREILDTPQLRALVRGIAFHWYSGDHFENLSLCREFFPEQELMFTEGCLELTTEKTVMGARVQSTGGSGSVEHSPWAFGEIYAHDILGNLNGGMNRFMDWNLLLDRQGGPNHVGNYCSAPIICDTEQARIYPQASYYAIAHFSRFLLRGSRRIAVSRYTRDLEATAAITPEGDLVAIVLNTTEQQLPVIFSLIPQGTLCPAEAPPHSLSTFVFHSVIS